jgi:release factor glutamine methyltransferase
VSTSSSSSSSSPSTISAALGRAAKFLRDSEIGDAQLNAQVLLAHAIGRDRTYLIVNFSEELSSEMLELFDRLLERRAEGEPLQYITGHQEFYGLEFEVTPGVLIPRPETELIIDEVIRLAKTESPQLIFDIGTGSGCIAITLARELPNLNVIATDVSIAALRVARRNAARHRVSTRISFLHADLLSPFANTHAADFIVSNPPYVAAAELSQLQREVRDWEPDVALTDYDDGLSFYRRLFEEAPPRLKTTGFLLCEMGYSQSEAVEAFVDPKVWSEKRILHDLQEIPRTIVLRKGM